MKFTNTTSTALLAGAGIIAIAVLSGLGHPVPAALVTLVGALVAGHLVLKVPGIGTVTVVPSSSSSSTSTPLSTAVASPASTVSTPLTGAATARAPESVAAVVQHPSVLTSSPATSA